MPKREEVHIFPHMQLVVAVVQIVFVFSTFMVFAVFVPIVGTDYVDLGASPVVRGHTFEGAKYWVMLGVLFLGRLVHWYTSGTLGRWRDELLAPDKVSPHSMGCAQRYYLLMFVNGIEYVGDWVRYATITVFMPAHLSFALAFFAGEGVVKVITSARAIPAYERIHERIHERGYAPLSTTDNNEPTERRLPDMQRRGLMSVPHSEYAIAAVVQVLDIAALFGVFWYADFVHSDYFSFTPPIEIFGFVIRGDGPYAGLLIAGFVNQLIASIGGAAVVPWLMTRIYNDACYDEAAIGYSLVQARFIYYSHLVSTWVRTIVIINLIQRQFIFTAVFMVADAAVKVVYTHNQLMRACYNAQGDAVPAPSPMTAAIIQLAEAVVAVVVTVSLVSAAATGTWDGPDPVEASDGANAPQYFDAPPPFEIFGKLFASSEKTGLLIGFIVFARAVATLGAEISTPFQINVLVGRDAVGIHYRWPDAVLIVAADTISDWVHRASDLQFMFSNIFFAFTSALTDIFVSALIVEFRFSYKRRCRRAGQDAEDDARIARAQERLAVGAARARLNDNTETRRARDAAAAVAHRTRPGETLSGQMQLWHA